MSELKVLQYSKQLNEIGIHHEILEHPALVEVEQVQKYLGYSLKDGFSTIVMRTNKGYIAVIRRDDCYLDSKKIKKILGVKSLNMATDEEFTKITGVPAGAAHILNPVEKTLIDRKVLEPEKTNGGSGSLSYTFRYVSSDLKKIPNSQIADVTKDILKTTGSAVKKRILTGDTPTGKLHIGHYVGSLENRIKLQHEYDTYIILANVHAYANYFQNSEKINQDVYNVFLDNLAVGIDPNVSTIFLESGIPELFELYGFFLTMVKHSRVVRNPSVKEEIKYKKLDPSIGFVVYPVLQAADILGFNANLVPVGEDQLPVIEQTREIARDFNAAYGDTFVIPEGKVGRVKRLVGTDGKMKMSKSGSNSILLSDDEATLKKKVMTVYTDPTRIHATDPGKVEGNPVFIYHDAFNPNNDEVKDLKERYLKGTVGDVEVKQKLFIALNNFLAPIREKRNYYESHPEITKEILFEGTKRARKTVIETVEKFREKIKLNSLIEIK